MVPWGNKRPLWWSQPDWENPKIRAIPPVPVLPLCLCLLLPHLSPFHTPLESKNELSVVLYWHHNQNCKGTGSQGNANPQDTASRGHCSRCDENYPRFPAATPAPGPSGLASLRDLGLPR